MKKIIIISILPLFLLFTSCEKVITVDLNRENPRLVVDAWINDLDSTNIITLTKTSNYFANSEPPAETGAEVKISNDMGQSETLVEGAPGKYYLTKLKRIPLHNYYLYIKTKDGKEYNATAYMPRTPKLDSISYIYQEANGFSKEGYFVTLWGEEPQDQDDWYRWNVYKNDSFFNESVVEWLYSDDKFVTGEINGVPFPTLSFKKDTKIQVDMFGTTKDVFTYLNGLFTVANSDGGLFSPPPSNPKSNISNDAFGYFAATSVVRKFTYIK